MQLSIYLGVYATIYVSMCEDPSPECVCIPYMYASWYVGVYATIYISMCEDPSQRSTLCCFVLQQCMLFVAASCTHAPCVALCCSNVCCLLQYLLVKSNILMRIDKIIGLLYRIVSFIGLFFTATTSAVTTHSLKSILACVRMYALRCMCVHVG